MKNDLYKILFGLGAAFGLPWLFLIVLPYLDLSAQEKEQVEYAESDEVDYAIAYPNYVASGRVAQGEKIYAANGCAYCHTQMVRPTYAGADMWRGWGGREADGLARETRPEDYAGEGYAFLGYQRIGPDLANVGTRISKRLAADNSDLDERQWHHLHLYNSRAMAGLENSVMPAFKHLYRTQKIYTQRSNDALLLTGKFAPEDGYEVVPTDDAENLVDYLLSRKKDAKLPASIVADGR